MRKEQYLNMVVDQIRCRTARDEIREELSEHIEEQTKAFMSEGLGKNEAEEAAVREMGDPVETGSALDRVHRPVMPWGMIALIVVLSIAGCALQHIFGQKIAGSDAADFTAYYNNAVTGREILYTVAGLLIMTAVCFVDYTRIAERARELMILLAAFVGAGTALLGVQMNGATQWIALGPITVNVLLALLLSVPLYAAVLYRYRGGGWTAVIKSILWMFPGSILAFHCNGVWMMFTLILTYLAVMAVAVYRGWFCISRKLLLSVMGTAAVLLPAGAAAYYYFFGASYQRERIAALFGMFTGETPAVSYTAGYARELLGKSRLIGPGMNLPDVSAMPEPSQILLSCVAGYYGILAALILAGALTFLLLRFLKISLSQKNQLGMLMGAGCVVSLLIQTGCYLLNNLGIWNVGSYCPFLSASGSGKISVYILLGILLSICRHKNTAPRRKTITRLFYKA